MFPTWSDWHIAYTKKGLARLWLGRLAKFLASMGSLIGLYLLWKAGTRPRDLPGMLGHYLRSGAATALGSLSRGTGALQEWLAP
jgi:hypothetical protein